MYFNDKIEAAGFGTKEEDPEGAVVVLYYHLHVGSLHHYIAASRCPSL